jgi:hypothetical protein
MDNLVNMVDENLHGIHEYEYIFNTRAISRKLMMPPGTSNQTAAQSVAGSLLASGWNRGNRDSIIENLARTTIADLNDYILEEDPSPITENRMRDLIADINNYLNNNGAAEAAGRHKRKSKKSRIRRSRSSRKSRSRRTRRTRRY